MWEEGAEDLETRLNHLHQLLKQPYDEINEFSLTVFVSLIAFIGVAGAGIIFVTTAPAFDGSFKAVLAYFFWGILGPFNGFLLALLRFFQVAVAFSRQNMAVGPQFRGSRTLLGSILEAEAL